MKKLLALITAGLLTYSSTSSLIALEKTYNLNTYQETIYDISKEFHTDFNMYTEKEYYANNLDEAFQLNYNEYLTYISQLSSQDIYLQFMEIINTEDEIEININNDTNTFSTKETKTVFFNNNKNKMVLTYKYNTSGGKKYYDTSYKSTAQSIKVGQTNYFVMSSYTGSFKNSNRTYSVVAKGKVYAILGAVSKTFTIDFNL